MRATTSGIQRVLFSRLLPQMQQKTRVPRPVLEPEIVEDSEPEREALRQAQRLERKRRKLDATQVNALESPKVVVISDTTAPSSPVTNIIEISDTSSELLVAVERDVISLHSSVASTRNAIDLDPSSASLHPDAAPSLLSEHSDDEEIVPTLDIAGFAFANVRPLQRRGSSLTAASSSSDIQTKAPVRTVSRNLLKDDLSAAFSAAQLKKITKCVSCDAVWTTRKTGEQKLVHIRKCAKKSGFTDDTVRILITKALENAPPGAGDPKGKAKVQPAPATLFQNVVADGTSKRKCKRKETENKLKTASETRTNIAEHARKTWGSNPFSEGDDFIAQSQAIRAESRATEPEPTQAFGPSRLAQRQRPSLLRQDSDEELDILPATQVFAPSKLGGRSIATGGWGYASASEDESAAPGSGSVSPKAANNPTVVFLPRTKEPSPKSTKKANQLAATPSSPAHASGDEWGDADAYVHYDPAMDKELIPEFQPPVTSPKLKSSKPRRLATTPRKRNITAPEDSPAQAAMPKTKTKRTRKKAEDEFDETWELDLRDKIVRDQDLHFRILRYEPIDFDIFLKLVTNGETAGGRLRLALRCFLDKQAINFYGGEAGKGHNRR